MLKFNELLEEFEYPDATVIDYKGKDIFIKQYLPAEDKYGLIYTSVESLDLANKPYNSLTAEILFDLDVVRYYSNINFDEVDVSYFKQFDVLQLNGLIDLVIKNIPVEEYEELKRCYEEVIQSTIAYNNSVGNSIQGLFSNLPSLGEELDGIQDPEKLQLVTEMIEELRKNEHI